MKSLWTAEANLPKFPPLSGDIKTDVLIIGGGITGILTAYLLEQKGIPYVLVEKNTICSGTTQNTTAKITYQHGLIYNKIIKDYNVEYAQMYLKTNKIAFEKIADLSKHINCDFEYKDNFVYSKNNYNILESELKALQKIGFDAKFETYPPIPISTVGAVCFKNQAQFHPLKFITIIAKGLNIYEKTFVKEMVGTTAITSCGKIKAKKVIVTTHFPFINKHGNYFLKLHQNRSYVIALENAQDVNGMYVDEDDTGMSFRNHKDLLLLGGGGHRTGENGGNWKELRIFSREKYKNSKELYHWATQDCTGLDKIPYIGKYSKNTPNLFVASGFNKWGMTNSMVSAIILNDMVVGSKNEFSQLFNPSRNILKFQLLVNGYKTTKNLLNFSTPRCPHLGCALKWNKAEHTWDCACHGSRFSEKGDVLDNPANGNFK